MRDGDGGWETRGLEVGWGIVEGLGSLDACDFAVGWWAGLKVFVGEERLWVGCCGRGYDVRKPGMVRNYKLEAEGKTLRHLILCTLTESLEANPIFDT